MYPRTEYEMSEEDLGKIIDACKPVPMIIVGGYAPTSPQQNANAAWAELGKRMGFDSDTVRPVDGKGTRVFTAIPSETEQQRVDRMVRETKERDAKEVESIKVEIERLSARLIELHG